MYSKKKGSTTRTGMSGYKIVGAAIIAIGVIAALYCLSQDNLFGAILSAFSGVPTGTIIMIGADILEAIKSKSE